MIIVSQYSYQASTIELRMQFCDIEISVYYLISCAIGVLIDDRIYPVIPRPRRFPDVQRIMFGSLVAPEIQSMNSFRTHLAGCPSSVHASRRLMFGSLVVPKIQKPEYDFFYADFHRHSKL